MVFNQLCLLKWLRGDSSVWLFSDMLIKGFLRKELLFAAKNSGCILDNLSDVYTVRPYLFLLFFLLFTSSTTTKCLHLDKYVPSVNACIEDLVS